MYAATPLDYPVDTRCFLLLWANHLPLSAHAALLPHLNTGAPGDIRLITQRGRALSQEPVWKLDVYGDRNANEYTGDLTLIRPGYLDNERIEVYHDGTDCVGSSAAVGYWMYWSPGSGIYYNVGRVAEFPGGYQNACWHFLGEDNMQCVGCCTSVHIPTIKAAREAGYDTLAFPRSEPGSHDGYTYELVAVKSMCDTRLNTDYDLILDTSGLNGVCPPSGWLTRGRNTPVQCTCNPFEDTINCDL